jgi:hypothetical protein
MATWFGSLEFRGGDRIAGERRHRTRVPLKASLFYECRETGKVRRGIGMLRDLSSGGLFFTSQTRLPPGAEVQITVDWPPVTDSKWSPKLLVSGSVLRSEPGGVAVKISRYEFRRMLPAASLAI